MRNDSPYLAAAARIETDISIFLKQNRRPLIAVTGSKGKSTTVSAVYHVFRELFPETDLGGNITVSPLTFCSPKTGRTEKLNNKAPVILELSSWQLADLKGLGLLKPKTAAITNIMHDHQDRYSSMDDYADDKAVIFEDMGPEDILFLNPVSDYCRRFAAAAKCSVRFTAEGPEGVRAAENIGGRAFEGAYLDTAGAGWWRSGGDVVQILNGKNILLGAHNRLNLLTAAALMYSYGAGAEAVRTGLSTFPGIAHRLEFIRETHGLRWYNDSASTIPEAAAAAVESFSLPVYLIAGGTDKDLDFSPLADAAPKAAGISLLAGSGTEKLISLFRRRAINYDGPFDSLQAAVENVISRTAALQPAGPAAAAVLSPGCASFGMFKNEFDRGDQFKALVQHL